VVEIVFIDTLGEKMPDKLEINIKTLTPIWTGGVEAGKCDRIHETGILGSLRWWMEVLVRGVGGNACDPTEQKCSAKNGLCPVCQLFGAEGQKRRFRLDVVQDRIQSDETVSSEIKLQPYQYQYKDKHGQEQTGTRTPTWYFPKKNDDKPKAGTFSIQIQSLHPSFKTEVIGGLIQFIADWSALGARPQMGFGVIQVEGNCIDMQALYDCLKKVEGEHKYPELPSLHNIFLAKIQPKDSNKAFTEKDTFNLKYDLRNSFRAQAGKPDNLSQLRHFILGAAPDDKKDNKTEDKRMAAKIKISRAYEDDKLMCVWGWVPGEAEVYKNGWSREKVVDKIYNHLTDKYTLHSWREINSTRDCKTPNVSDGKIFLHSLLKLQESGDAV
jgi:CRISPR-associated protein Cmr1